MARILIPFDFADFNHFLNNKIKSKKDTERQIIETNFIIPCQSLNQ